MRAFAFVFVFVFVLLPCVGRDGLVEVLRSMLSMHLNPPQLEEDDEEGDGDDGIEGAPRVLTLDQVCRGNPYSFGVPVRLTISLHLQSIDQSIK